MNQKSALSTVFLVVLVDLMGFGIVLPLLPFYASRFEASALTIGLLYSVYSLAQLIFSPFWGSLSDRVGRRPVMLLSTLGSSLAYLLFAFSGSLSVLFASRLLAGVMGGNISAAQACVADVTLHEDRAKGMGLIGAAFGIGFVLGPALSSILIHAAGQDPRGALNPYALPGWVAAGLSFCSFLLVCFFLPETAKKNISPLAGDGDTGKTSLFNRSFWIALGKQKGAVLPSLLMGAFILSMGQSSLYSSFPLFCKKNFLLSPERVGVLFVWMGLVAVFVQGGLLRVLVRKFSEKNLFLWGNILMITGMALIAVSPSEPGLIFSLCVMSAGTSLNVPTLTSLISKHAGPLNTGRILGGSQGLSALGRVVGPAWGGVLFAAHPRLPFLATSAVLTVMIYTAGQLKKMNHQSIDQTS